MRTSTLKHSSHFSDSAILWIEDQVKMIRHKYVGNQFERPFKPLLGKNGEELDAASLLGKQGDAVY